MTEQKISTFLWFDHQAEEAANFYVSIFPNSSVGKIARFSDSGPGAKGSVMTVAFQLDGQQFTGLNGGPIFKFTETVSFVVHCETQPELDKYWEGLPKAVRKANVAGSKTNLANRGKSFPRSLSRCFRIKIRQKWNVS